jgi:hypothetical protein
MPIRPDAPLRKVTLNLYESDYLALSDFYGYGWSEMVRTLVHQHVLALKPSVRTLGDLPNDH